MVYVRICLYACIYMCVYLYVRISLSISLRVHIYESVSVCICVCLSIWTCMHISIYMYLCVCVHCACTLVWVYVCVHARMHASMSVWLCESACSLFHDWVLRSWAAHLSVEGECAAWAWQPESAGARGLAALDKAFLYQSGMQWPHCGFPLLAWVYVKQKGGKAGPELCVCAFRTAWSRTLVLRIPALPLSHCCGLELWLWVSATWVEWRFSSAQGSSWPRSQEAGAAGPREGQRRRLGFSLAFPSWL